MAGIGYPDGQRVENYDGPVFYHVQGAPITGTQPSAAFDVSRFAYLGGYLNCFGNFANLTFNWYADQAKTFGVGSRFFTMAQMVDNAQIRIPNLGPWVEIVPSLFTAGANWNFNAALFGTNRAHPCEFIPINNQVMELSEVCAANAHTTFSPATMFSGPCRVAGSFDVGSYELTFNARAADGSSRLFDDQGIFSTTPFSFDTMVPGGWWFIDVFNSAGSGGTLTIAVTPSLTGSL